MTVINDIIGFFIQRSETRQNILAKKRVQIEKIKMVNFNFGCRVKQMLAF